MSDLRFIPLLQVYWQRIVPESEHPPLEDTHEAWDAFFDSCREKYDLKNWGFECLQSVEELLLRPDLLGQVALLEMERQYPAYRAESVTPGKAVPADWQHALDGGFAAMRGETVVMWPQCCCEIKCVEEWLRAAGHRLAKRVGFDIGHDPGAWVGWSDGLLHFTEAEEDRARFSATSDEVVAALMVTLPIFQALADAIESQLRETYGDDARSLAHHISGLNAFLTAIGRRETNWKPADDI